MIERVLIVLAVAVVAGVLVSLRERARPRHTLRATPGITVFTGPDCRLCPPLLTALEATGVAYRTVDVTQGDVPGIRALPTLLVADRHGAVSMRRSGRAALADLDAVVAAAGREPGRSSA